MLFIWARNELIPDGDVGPFDGKPIAIRVYNSAEPPGPVQHCFRLRPTICDVSLSLGEDSPNV
jgi:hypothetical protein